jgi:hypothetical protein
MACMVPLTSQPKGATRIGLITSSIKLVGDEGACMCSVGLKQKGVPLEEERPMR